MAKLWYFLASFKSFLKVDTLSTSHWLISSILSDLRSISWTKSRTSLLKRKYNWLFQMIYNEINKNQDRSNQPFEVWIYLYLTGDLLILWIQSTSLHSSNLIWRPTPSKKNPTISIRTLDALDKYCIPVHNTSFDTFGLKTGLLFTPKLVVKFLRNSILGPFWSEWQRATTFSKFSFEKDSRVF